MAVTDPVPRRRDIWRRAAERDGYDYWPEAILPRFGDSANLETGSVAALLQLDARAGLLELALQLVGLVALDALLDRLRRLVDERLRLLQAEPGGRAHDLDHLDLLVTWAGEHDVDGRGLLLGGRAVAGGGARAGRGGGRAGGRRHAELLLERLDALGELEHRDALQLVDPLLGAGSHVSLALLCCFALGGRVRCLLLLFG